MPHFYFDKIQVKIREYYFIFFPIIFNSQKDDVKFPYFFFLNLFTNLSPNTKIVPIIYSESFFDLLRKIFRFDTDSVLETYSTVPTLNFKLFFDSCTSYASGVHKKQCNTQKTDMVLKLFLFKLEF